jgi:hypothetical protein
MLASLSSLISRSRPYLVATSGERQRSHFERRGLQRDPGCAGIVIAERPIVLICAPRGETAACFLVKRLVVVDANPSDAHQLRGDAGKPFAKREVPANLVLRPKIHDLEEDALVG